jgi:hypothetical protein
MAQLALNAPQEPSQSEVVKHGSPFTSAAFRLASSQVKRDRVLEHSSALYTHAWPGVHAPPQSAAWKQARIEAGRGGAAGRHACAL